VSTDRLPGEYTDARKVESSVVDAIADLPVEFREAVQLRDLDGLSYDEIAKIIDCPVGTVKSRVNRGRLRLQKRLRALADEFLGGVAPGTTVLAN
jgi:RNA polymerase sigma-70 factor (ECF subfamily)